MAHLGGQRVLPLEVIVAQWEQLLSALDLQNAPRPRLVEAYQVSVQCENALRTLLLQNRDQPIAEQYLKNVVEMKNLLEQRLRGAQQMAEGGGMEVDTEDVHMGAHDGQGQAMQGAFQPMQGGAAVRVTPAEMIGEIQRRLLTVQDNVQALNMELQGPAAAGNPVLRQQLQTRLMQETDQAHALQIEIAQLQVQVAMAPVQERRVPRLPFAERYELQRTLRDTIYGRVHIGVDRASRRPYAIKMSKLARMRNSNTLENPMEEIRLMRVLHRDGGGHINIVRFIEDDEDQEWHYTVLELCTGGEFFDYVVANGALSNAQAKAAFRQVVSGLEYIHRHNIVHLDMSLENLLLDEHRNVKICDFGMARQYDGRPFPAALRNRPGKLGYQAPEIFAGQPFDGKQADLYSVGVILFIMLTANPPYQNPTHADKRFDLIYSGRARDLLSRWGFTAGPRALHDDAIDLIQHLMCPPNMRFTLQQVMNHRWLNSP